MKVVGILLLTVVALIGCASMPPGIVVTYDKSDVNDCKRLGTVMNNGWYDGSQAQAINHIAMQTADLGGNTVLVQSQNTGMTASYSANPSVGTGFAVTEYSAMGTAYDCSAPTVAAATSE